MSTTVLFSNDGDCPLLIAEEEIAEIAREVLSREHVGRDVSVSVSLVDDEEMRGLNRTWRQIDAPTDVLSFECDSPFDEDIPADEVVELGDVILAPGVIAQQAPSFGNEPADEFRLMLVHGMLHLLGHDHLDDAEAEEMEARELEILRALAASRGADPESVTIGPTTRHLAD